jgi:hypothetical protein
MHESNTEVIMKAEVQTLNEEGRLIPARDRKKMRKYSGTLRFHEARSGELGRVSPMAVLVSETDTAGTPTLPPLHDAVVLFMRDGVLRIRGFEFRNGVQYGQTWDVRVS